MTATSASLKARQRLEQWVGALDVVLNRVQPRQILVRESVTLTGGLHERVDEHLGDDDARHAPPAFEVAEVASIHPERSGSRPKRPSVPAACLA